MRVLAVVEQRLQETLRSKLASCRENVELASDAPRWTPVGATVSIRWLSAPGGDRQQATVYKIDPSGAPTQQ